MNVNVLLNVLPNKSNIMPFIEKIGHYLGAIGSIFTDTHPSYFIFAAVFSVFAIVIWISVKYPFWNTQPVYHTYDFWRRFWYRGGEPYMIQRIPTKTRYYDKTGRIKTVGWAKVEHSDMKNMLKLVNSCFIPSDRILLDIQENEWAALFDEDTFVSIVKSGEQEQEKSKGVVISKPVISRIGTYETSLNFVDYLTVSRDHPKPDASKILFSTHEYNVRMIEHSLGEKIKPSLLKHESGEYAGVVPFIKYELVQYHMDKLAPWALPIMPPHIQLVSCVEQIGVGKKRRFEFENTDVLNDFAKSFLDLPIFEVKVWAGLPALLRQFSVGSLQMYALKSYGDILAVYFMRNARTYYEELSGANTLECVAAVSFMDMKDADLFYGGFLLAIRQMLVGGSMESLKLTQQNYGVLSVAGIGHNVVINNRLPKKDVILRTQCEYILHNMVAPKSPYSPESVLVIL